MLNALKVVFFGQQMNNEIHTVNHAIEFAFDQYRQNLLTMMKSFEEVVDKIDQIDRLTNCKFFETHKKIKTVAAQYPVWWEHNEMTLRRLVAPTDMKFVYAILPGNEVDSGGYLVEEPDGVPIPPNATNDENNTANATSSKENRDVASYNSIIQLIVHITRDWSAAGNSVRQKLYYDQVIPKLVEHLPLPTSTNPNSSTPSILIPGAGAGRLAWEIASLGYKVEANECSATMVCFMNKLFNDVIPHNKHLSIYPYLHLLFQDDWDLEMRSTMINFPYIEDAYYSHEKHSPNRPSAFSSLPLLGSLSVQYGDFVKIYGQSKDYEKQYDAIVTNFFIDTGRSILDYLAVIEAILKPNGIWINIGPLHYHSKQSMPYSYKHLMEIVQASGFRILSYDTVENSYCGEEKISMKPEVYRIPMNVFQLKRKRRESKDKEREKERETLHDGESTELLETAAKDGDDEEEDEEEVLSVKIINEEKLCQQIIDEGKVYDEVRGEYRQDELHEVKFTRPNYKVLN